MKAYIFSLLAIACLHAQTHAQCFKEESSAKVACSSPERFDGPVLKVQGIMPTKQSILMDASINRTLAGRATAFAGRCAEQVGKCWEACKVSQEADAAKKMKKCDDYRMIGFKAEEYALALTTAADQSEAVAAQLGDAPPPPNPKRCPAGQFWMELSPMTDSYGNNIPGCAPEGE